MVLAKCSNCGKGVSFRVDFCPNRGCPSKRFAEKSRPVTPLQNAVTIYDAAKELRETRYAALYENCYLVFQTGDSEAEGRGRKKCSWEIDWDWEVRRLPRGKIPRIDCEPQKRFSKPPFRRKAWSACSLKWIAFVK